MTTTTAGGKISGRIALTCIGPAALLEGDPVHLTDDYTVALADGTKPVLGHVTVRNVKRVAGAFPVDNPGGDVTVEARGLYVDTWIANGALTAGVLVGHGAAPNQRKISPAGAGVSTVGIALMTVADGEAVDVLVQG